MIETTSQCSRSSSSMPVITSGTAIVRRATPIEGLPAMVLAVCGATAGISTGWHVSLNDFWGNVVLAERIHFSVPSTWHSGFFPCGYLLALHLIPENTQVAAGYAASLLAAVALVFVITRAVARWVGPIGGAVAGLMLAVWPSYFQYATTPGPDLPSVALCASGLAILAVETSAEPSTRRLLIAGGLMGLAALIRYHLAIPAFAAVAAWALVGPAPRRTALFLSAGVVAALAVQAFVNVSGGHGPLETAQAFNVYRMMYGIDWATLTGTSHLPTLADVILSDPSRFARAYSATLIGLLPYCMPGILAVVVCARHHQGTRTAWLLMIVQVLYVLVVAMAASSRGGLVLLPLGVLSVGLATRPFVDTGAAPPVAGRVRLALLMVVLLMIALGTRHAVADLRVVQGRMAEHATFVSIEQRLQARGIDTAKQVFTTDLSYYLPHLSPHVPYANGGWYRLDSPDYDQTYPALCLRNPACLVDDARRHGVRAIVLRLARTPPSLFDRSSWPRATWLAAPRGWMIAVLDTEKRSNETVHAHSGVLGEDVLHFNRRDPFAAILIMSSAGFSEGALFPFPYFSGVSLSRPSIS